MCFRCTSTCQRVVSPRSARHISDLIMSLVRYPAVRLSLCSLRYAIYLPSFRTARRTRLRVNYPFDGWPAFLILRCTAKKSHIKVPISRQNSDNLILHWPQGSTGHAAARSQWCRTGRWGLGGFYVCWLGTDGTGIRHPRILGRARTGLHSRRHHVQPRSIFFSFFFHRGSWSKMP